MLFFGVPVCRCRRAHGQGVIGRLRISTQALRDNAEALRNLVGPQHAAFVVKGNAYGHGMVDTALAIEGLANRLCVYAVDEALNCATAGSPRRF